MCADSYTLTMSYSRLLHNEAETEQMGQALADALSPGLLLTFSGKLGAGKTCLIRAMLRHLGVSGPIKSPSFALVEPYNINSVEIYHIDLYRLSDPEELEFLGIRDYLNQNAVCLIEWPEKGALLLPEADCHCRIEYAGDGRQFSLSAQTDRGQQLMRKLQS